MKLFTEADVVSGNHILTAEHRKELLWAPTAWKATGRQQTASGYGKRLNSGWKINFEGRLYRVYCTCFSNVASYWFTVRGRRLYVD